MVSTVKSIIIIIILYKTIFSAENFLDIQYSNINSTSINELNRAIMSDNLVWSQKNEIKHGFQARYTYLPWKIKRHSIGACFMGDYFYFNESFLSGSNYDDIQLSIYRIGLGPIYSYKIIDKNPLYLIIENYFAYIYQIFTYQFNPGLEKNFHFNSLCAGTAIKFSFAQTNFGILLISAGYQYTHGDRINSYINKNIIETNLSIGLCLLLGEKNEL